MQPHGRSGRLIVVDGTDGSGKTSLLAGLCAWLRARGVPAEIVKTPSADCRAVTAFRRYAEVPARALTGEIDLPALSLVCLGDRLQTARTEILPLLESGTWVLCDRWAYSTLAELTAIGASQQDRAAIRAVIDLLPKPDLAVLTTVAPEEAIRRVHARPEERDSITDRELFARFVEAFRAVAHEEGMFVLETDRGEERALASLQPLLEQLLPRRNPPRPSRAVVFDLFGTIAPPFSRTRYEQMMRSVASCLGVEPGTFRELWIANAPDLLAGRILSSEVSLRRVAERLRVAWTDDDLQSALEIISDFVRGSLVAAPAHLDMVDRLRRDGFRVGLLSNCSPDVPRLWSETALADRFDATCFSCAIGAMKPAPEAYLEICRRLGVDPADCLYIGDGSDDELTAARRLGMRAVLVRSSTTDTYDVRRRDVEEWDGDAVATLADLAAHFLQGASTTEGARS